MEKKNRYPCTLWSVTLCALFVFSFTSFAGLARSSSSSYETQRKEEERQRDYEAQRKEEKRRREEKYDREALEKARETQQRFPEAYRNVCVPAALGSGRRLDQYYLHLAPKSWLRKPLDGLEAQASRAADGYSYTADSRYARLLPLLRAHPLALGDSETQAVLKVLSGLAEDESRAGVEGYDTSAAKSGKNDCARFAALLSDAESFMNAPGNPPFATAVFASIMEGAFADSENYVHASPLWKYCGDETLRLKAADLLVLSQKEARAKQAGDGYGTGIRYDPLMRAYHTAMARIADPDRRAVWYAESVAYHAGERHSGNELEESLLWLQRFEPTGTYEAGKKIVDDFNERYRNVLNAGIHGHKENLYDAYPAYRSAYYRLYAKTGDKRALEAMLPAVCDNGPAMERNRLFFEAEIAFILGQYEKGLMLFARYAAEKGRRDEMYFLNSSKGYLPGYYEKRPLAYRVWEGYGDRRKLAEKQTDSLQKLLAEYKESLLRECLERGRPDSPLSKEEAACAQEIVTRMAIQ